MLGPAADVTLDTYLLRRIELRLAGANWQRGGGKGKRPEPVPLPGEKTRQAQQSKSAPASDVVQRLRNLGLMPASAGQMPPSADELRRETEDMWLDREKRLATES